MAKPRRTTARPARANKSVKKAASAQKKTARPGVRKATSGSLKPGKSSRPVPARPKTAKPVPARGGKARASKAVKAKPTTTKSGPARSAALPPSPPVGRSTYADAVATYERGMKALQAKKYRDAADILRTVIATYPEEKELHERAQLYLRVCERQLAPLDATPKTPEEQVYAATLALNAGALDRAVSLLSAALQQDRENDRAEYMLGVALSMRGDIAGAVAHLERAARLNAENRELIAKEPDLEAVRQTDAIRALLTAPQPPRKDKERRPAARGRAAAR